MPPKRKARSSLASVSTPKTPTPLRDEDSVDVDTPQAACTPATPAATTTSNNKHNYPPDAEVLGNLWTADQESSLFKAIIRWKPTGMHKHFRMLSISEHLRNHGFDPDVEAHTRIPSIWAKLRTQYDLDIIDDRDNIYRGEAAGVVGDGGTGAGAGASALFEELYRDFELPPDDFHEDMFSRRLAGPNDPPSSPAEWDADAPVVPTRKRKRGAAAAAADTSSVAGSTATKTRASTVEDTDQETPFPSSPAARTARGARSRKRAAAKAKAESVDPEPEESGDEEEEEEEEDGEEDGEDEEEEDEEEEEQEEDSDAEDEAPPAKASRGSTTRGRGRGRGRGKRGRK